MLQHIPSGNSSLHAATKKVRQHRKAITLLTYPIGTDPSQRNRVQGQPPEVASQQELLSIYQFTLLTPEAAISNTLTEQQQFPVVPTLRG